MGRDWRSLKSNELWPTSLSFFTSQAYRYYLPAFLLASLEEDSGDVVDSVLWKLTPEFLLERRLPGYKGHGLFDSRHADFTLAQKNVIRDFLQYLMEDLLEYFEEEKTMYDEKAVTELRALRDFWETF